MFKYQDPEIPEGPGTVTSITTDKQAKHIQRLAARRKKTEPKSGTENVDIVGELVSECLIDYQIFIIQCKIAEASNEIKKLETLIKEQENEKTLSDYDTFIRACRILR